MYGVRTGLGLYFPPVGGLGDETADTATAVGQVSAALYRNPSLSVGNLISTFQTEFPQMTLDDATGAAQAGMLQFVKTQQPAIPLSTLAFTISQLGASATVDSVTNFASSTLVVNQTSMQASSYDQGKNNGIVPILDPIPGGTSVLPGSPPINPQIPAASGTVAPPPAPTNTTSVPILDTSTGNVLPPSAGQTTAVPAVPALPISAPAPSPTPSTGAPATAAAFSLCFPGDPSGPIASSVPVCTYTAIGAAIILAFFFMKK